MDLERMADLGEWSPGLISTPTLEKRVAEASQINAPQPKLTAESDRPALYRNFPDISVPRLTHFLASTLDMSRYSLEKLKRYYSSKDDSRNINALN